MLLSHLGFRNFHCILAAVLATLCDAGAASSRAWAQADPGAGFRRGDANGDGSTDIGDAVQVLVCHFLGTGCTGCPDSSDADDNGVIEVSDPVYLLTFLFLRGPQPPAPGETCGADPTDDALSCAAFAPCSPPDPDSIPTGSGPLRVIPIEHATLALQWNGKTVLVDPVGGAAPFASLPDPDLILVTDIHGDHLDLPTLRAVVAAGTVIVVPAAVSQSIQSGGGLASGEIRVLANGQTTGAADLQIEAIPMYNITTGRLQYHSKGRGNGYVLDAAGARVYISGDTEDIPEMRALAGIDLAFLCMNLPFTMTPQQAASAVLEFKPGVVYPYHYSSSQNSATFKSLVEAGNPQDIEVRLRNWYP